MLHVYPKGDYFTGAAMQLRELAAGLAARGHAVTVATPPSAVWAGELARAGVAHEALPMTRPLDPRAIWRLRQMIRRREIQVVHAHKGRARTLTMLATLTGVRPRLVLNRGVSFRVAGLRRLGYTTRRVDVIVAVCESIKRGLVEAGVAAEKIEVIYSGTDVDRFRPGLDGTGIRRELGVAADAFLITQIGVRSWRGWADVLDAMVSVAPAAPSARLLFVGAPAPRMAQLQAEAARRGLEGRVLVLGHRIDVPLILAGSDLVVDASWAGLGITGSIREALACARPVVATRLEGMPELVVDGETGRLVPPRDPAALAAAIREMIEHPDRARRMAEGGRKHVVDRFSLEAKLEATEALYRRLVLSRRVA